MLAHPPNDSDVKEEEEGDDVHGLPDDEHGVAPGQAEVTAHLEEKLDVVVGMELEQGAVDAVTHQFIVQQLVVGLVDHLQDAAG